MGNALLAIALAGTPAEEDIVLIRADRLTPTSGAQGYVHFKDMPDGTPIVRQFGGWEYTWNLDYFDEGPDDGEIDSHIMLDFVSRTLIPEPAAGAVISLLAACAMASRRRRHGTAPDTFRRAE